MPQTEIVIGVCGGVAAYKSAALVSTLVQRGIGVHVVMTQSATSFVGAATFTALTGRPVVTEMFDDRHPLGPHIELARDSSVLCIAPATARFLAAAAHGDADDVMSTLYLCHTGKVLVAPTMNCEMWDHPAVKRNVQQVKLDGVTVIEPEEGWLSCRSVGKGRMASPQQIVAAIENAIEQTEA